MDTDALVQTLGDLGVTTYYWLIWHARTDWEDLKLFLPKAAKAHIEVWVYLVPPTEGPPAGYAASEPFGMDYPRWGEEIARLSLEHPNLTGWVMDDFYANHDLFTPAYIRDMQARAKRINPMLVFLPLMYFYEINRQFTENYREVIDGVVVAYPNDREEINDARAILDGERLVSPSQLGSAWHTASSPGDFVSASISARVTTSRRVRLRFSEQDDFTGATAGYHFKQLLVDGAVVWEEDVAGGTNRWREIDLDITSQARGKTKVALTFRLLDKQGVSNFGVRWRLKDLRAEGLHPAATLNEPRRWQVEQRGPLEAGFGKAAEPRPRRFHIPFIVMTAATTSEFRLRHGEPASAERMAKWLGMCLQAWRDGQCDGVVTYCLEKQPQSQVFPLARKLFREYGTSAAQARLSSTNLLLFHNRKGEVEPVKTKSDWQKRRSEILKGMQEVMGPLPGKEKRCSLDVKIEEEADCGAYIRQRITYASEPGSRVPAFLLIPKEALGSKKKYPAVLALHPTDMEYGYRVAVEQLRDNYRAYGRDLAERGFVVLAPAYPLMANYQPDLKTLGYSSGTMKAIWDNIRGLDLLESLLCVRKGNFGAVGHSLGGHNAIYTAVFDERIKVIVSSCGFDSYLDYMEGNIKGWASERYMPKLLEYQNRLEEIPFDFYELIGALTPRSVFINAPLKDANFKWRSVDKIVLAALPVYQLYRVPQKLRVEHPDCGHDFPPEMRELAYRLLDDHLK